MSEQDDIELSEILDDFVSGLLKRAKCNHAGNCLVMSRILKPYLDGLFGIETLLKNAKVKQGKRKINHYYLLRIKDGIIIDGTASQFTDPNGNRMPKIYIGKKPKWYIDI